MIMDLAFPLPRRAYPMIFITVFAFVAGILNLFWAKFRTTVIDRNLQMISFTVRRVFGTKHCTYRFGEIAKSFGGLRVNTDYRSSPNPGSSREYKVYGIKLPLANGEDPDLTEYSNLQLRSCERVVAEANKYING